MEAPKFLGAFNFPGGKVTQGRRDVTNVPAQALALLNDPFVLQQADVWAASLVGTARRLDLPPGSSICSGSLSAVRPTDEERSGSSGRSASSPRCISVPAEGVLKSQAVWKDMAHAMFNLKEFIYIP